MMKIAKDIMTTDVITLKPSDDVEKLARLLLEHKISGVPVVDDEGKLVGVVSEGDLVFQEKQVRNPFYVVVFDSPIYLERPKRFIEDVKRAVAQQVGELMSTNLYTAKPETSLKRVATIMTEKGVNRVPVVDDEGKLLGIISRQDIIRASFSDKA